MASGQGSSSRPAIDRPGAAAEDSGAPLEDATQEIAAWALADEFDVPLAEARARMERQPLLFELSDRLQAAAGDAWGASWIDQATGGQLVVNITGSGLIDEALRKFGAGLDVRVEVVPFSLARLQADNISIQHELDAAGVAAPGSFVDFKTNRAIVEYQIGDALRKTRESGATAFSSDENEARALAIAAKYDTVVARPTESIVAPFAGCSASFGACDPPLRGGMETFAPIPASQGGGLATCTTGFNVRSKSDHAPYVLTAAHCRKDLQIASSTAWSTYFQGLSTHVIGPTWNEVGPTAGSDDEAILAVNYPGGWSLPERTRVLVQSSGGTRPTVTDTDYTIDAVGLSSSVPADGYLCTSGAVTDTGCHLYVGTSGAWWGVLTVRQADGERVCVGDSGGAVYAFHKGYGIIQGGDLNALEQYSIATGTAFFACAAGLPGGSSPNVYYVSLFRAMSQLNVELSPP